MSLKSRGVESCARLSLKAGELCIERPWACFLLLFSIAVAVRLGFLFGMQREHIQWTGELEQIALTLTQTGAFANPYMEPTGPTAHNAPGLVFIFALIFKFFGAGFAGFAVKCSFIAACYGVLYGAMPKIARGLGLPAQVGLLAGLVGATLPLRRSGELHMAWEEPISALLFAAAGVLTIRAWRAARLDWRTGLSYGALWGAAFHFAPALLPAFVALLGVTMWRAKFSRRSVKWVTAAALACLAVIAPWTIRNKQQLGAWMFMRSNFGLELLVSNNDLAGPTIVENNEIYQYFHPGFSEDVAREVARAGEVNFHKAALEQAKTWIETHPRRFAELTRDRFVAFWMGGAPRFVTSWLIGGITLLGFAGLWMAWRDGRQRMVWLFGAIWVSFPLLYYFVQINQRYRIPMEWTVLLSASYAVLRAIELSRAGSRTEREREEEQVLWSEVA